MTTMNERIGEIVERNLEVMIGEVQKLIGVTEGDVAGQYFSGDELKNTIVLGLMDYVVTELQMQLDDLEEKAQNRVRKV